MEESRRLRDVPATTVKKNIKQHTKDVHSFLSVYKEYVDERAKLEHEHAKNMNMLHLKFKATAAPFVGSIATPAVTNMFTLMVDETKSYNEILQTLANDLIEKVSTPLAQFTTNSKVIAKRLLGDRDQEEKDLVELDANSEAAHVQSEESYKKVMNNADGKDASVRNVMLRKSQTALGKEKEILLAHARITHNTYALSVDAANAHRSLLWTSEIPLLLDQLESEVYDTLITQVQTTTIAYVNILKEATEKHVETINTITEGTNKVNVKQETARLSETLAEVQGDAFIQPGDHPMKPHTDYGAALWIDKYTFYGLNYIVDESKQNLKEMQEKKAAEEKKLQAVQGLLTTVTETPQFGGTHAMNLEIIEGRKKIREMNLHIARLQANIDQLEVAGIHGDVKPSHVFSKPSLLTRSDNCAFCGDQAGGVCLSNIAGSSKVCKQCNTMVHEGRHMAMCWTPCVNDDLLNLLDQLPQPVNESKAYSSRRSMCALEDKQTDYLPESDSDSIVSETNNNNDAIRQRLGSFMNEPIRSPDNKIEDSTTRMTATIVYDYQPVNYDEVEGKAGQKVTVLTQEGDWVNIEIEGKTGLFPRTYLRMDGNQRKVVKKLSPVKKEPVTMIALYDYKATVSDELDLVEGDQIVILGGDEGGWTQGRIGDRSGIFPTSYAALP